MADATKQETLFTIGHSNHTFEHFVSLLQMNGIEMIADVRSLPVSRLSWFSKQEITQRLSESGIQYKFLGDNLGGRGWLKSDGTSMQCEEIAATQQFQAGLVQLAKIMEDFRTCIMCSEADASDCHRTRFIAPSLPSHVKIFHVLRDGSARPHAGDEMQLFLRL